MAQPILAAQNTWFTQGGSSVACNTITEIEFKDTYTPTSTPTASWDASAAKDGSVMAYVEGSKLTIAGNGTGKIFTNQNSSSAFANFTKLTKITGGDLLDTSGTTNMAQMFDMCFDLTMVDVSGWDTQNVTTMRFMFRGTSSLESLDVSGWQTGKVTDMRAMFNCPEGYFNTSLTKLDVSSWDTVAVEDMSSMFTGHLSLTELDVSGWDTALVKDMAFMFAYCNALTTLDVGSWDTGNVTTMVSMFRGCTSLETLDVSNWNTGKVNTMQAMFSCGNDYAVTPMILKELDVSNWDTSNVEDMSFMFYGFQMLSVPLAERILPVSKWDVSKVKNFDHMFAHSSIYLDDTSKWKTSSAENLGALFHTIRNKTIDVSNFETKNAFCFGQMFEACYASEIRGLTKFDTSNGIDFQEMFNKALYLEKLDLSSFDTSKARVGDNISTNGGTAGCLLNMFSGCHRLSEVTLGEKFTFIGDGSNLSYKGKLPAPGEYPHPDIPTFVGVLGSDGNWYTMNCEVYAPEEIPNNTKQTYYASRALARNVDLLIKSGTVCDIADAIREKTGEEKSYNPKTEMPDAIRSIVSGGEATTEIMLYGTSDIVNGYSSLETGSKYVVYVE